MIAGAGGENWKLVGLSLNKLIRGQGTSYG